jgi:hypothetical protein
MLVPLGLYLLIMLITCTMILLICWAYDTERAEIEAGRSDPADLEFPVRPNARRSHIRFPAPRLPERGRRSLLLRPRLNSSNGRPMACSMAGGVASRFHLVPDLEDGHRRHPRPRARKLAGTALALDRRRKNPKEKPKDMHCIASRVQLDR